MNSFLGKIRQKISKWPSWKIFVVAGGFLIIVGEIADVILTRAYSPSINLWVQILIAVLMVVLLIYTLNRGRA